jgi:hypothetical protein
MCLEENHIKIKDIFGDIFFATKYLKNLYVSERVDAYTDTSNDEDDSIPIYINQKYSNLLTNNEIVIFNGALNNIENITTNYRDQLDSFLQNNSDFGLPEASLDIVYLGSSPRIQRLLILIGGIGSGKTTLLTNYIKNNKKIKQLWLDFTFKNCYENLNKASIFRLLKKHIEKIEKDNIGRHDFRTILFEDEINKNISFFERNNKIRENILKNKIQEWFENDEIFVLSYLQYMLKHGEPVIVFDNIDLHPLHNQLELYEFAKEIIDINDSVRFIISMREYSFCDFNIEYRNAILNQPIIHITAPDSKLVILKRINYLTSLLKPQITIQSSYTESNNKIKIIHNDVMELIQDIIKPLLYQRSILFLKCITNHNIRQILNLVISYISSPYLIKTRFIKGLINKSISVTKEPKISFDEFLEIMILNSWQYFEKKIYTSKASAILNIYTTELGNDGNAKLLRYHLLTFILKLAEIGKWVNKKDIFDCLCPTLLISETVLLNELQTLMNNGAIESPEGSKVNECNTFLPTRKSWYYIHKLSKYLTYIRLIRNDLPLDFVHKSSNISTPLDYDELLEYLKFIDWIRRIEINEVKALSESENRFKYMQLAPRCPICFKIFKSLTLRIKQLKDKGYLSGLNTIKTTETLKKFFNEIKRNINDEKLVCTLNTNDLYKMINNTITEISLTS